MRPLIALFLSGLVLSHCKSRTAQSELDYYGKDSQEGDLTFSTYVEFEASSRASEQAVIDATWAALSDQLKHLFGSLKDHTGSEADGVINFAASPGVPKTSHKINVTHTEKISTTGSKSIYRAHYTYADKAAFAKDFFRSGEKQLNLRLPKNPDEIYKIGVVDGVNMCTDEHYNSEGDFWYFWNPYKEECPAVVLDRSVLVEAKLAPIANTTLTLPEYDRLAEDGVIDITYIVGPDDSKDKVGDLGRAAFDKTFAILTQGKAVLSNPKVSVSRGTRKLLSAIPEKNNIAFKVLEDKGDQRTLYAFHDGKKIVVQMFFLDPWAEAFPFASAVRDAIMSADIFLFDGHSGLGGNLPVSRFFAPGERKFLTNKYQILFFNGCSTFAYYNEEYFAQKVTDEDIRGTKNLDIVTTSIGAPWSTAADVDAIFMLGLLNGTRPSWQKLMDDIYDVEPRSTALTQVNGDEDNPSSLSH